MSKPVKPFTIRLSGGYITEDRKKLEAHLRKSIGIPSNQPMEFVTDELRPVSDVEKQMLRGGAEHDSEPQPEPEPESPKRRIRRKR